MIPTVTDDDVLIIAVGELRILSQSIAEELSNLPTALTLTLMPPSPNHEVIFRENVEEFNQGQETVICGKLKETQQSVMLLRLKDGGYGLLSASRPSQHPDEVSKLIKEAMMPMLSPAVVFDIPDAQAHDLPLDADRCRVCKQKRCRVHGRQRRS